MEVINESYATVLYDEEKELGIIIWEGKTSFDEYKKPFQALIKLANSGHTITRFLSDTTSQGVVSPEKRKWFEKEMFPQAIAAGLKKVAVVTDGNVFKRYYINMVISAINKFEIPVKIFANQEEAIKALMKS